jgi:hypothetical protein
MISAACDIPENAFALMNARGASFDPLEVLQILPDDIPLEKIENFLCTSNQNALTELRMKRVEASLCRMERILFNDRLYKARSRSIVVDRYFSCNVCRAPIGDSVFVCFPNGVIAHHKCMEDPSICPLSGRNFKTHPFLPES